MSHPETGPVVPDRTDTTKAPPIQPINSVANALKLLEMFEAQRSVRVAHVGRHLGVARSTAHRLLQVLHSHGYVEQDQETRAYLPGPALVRMAVSIARGLDLRTVARPIMQELVERLGETIHLSVLRDAKSVFIESIETTRALRVGVRTGLTLPAHATASGRVLLAELVREDLHRVLPHAELPAVTERTVTSRAELEAMLAGVRETGFATSLGESEEDVASVAVPVRDSHGRTVAAMALAAPPSRVPSSTVATVAAALVEGAARISTSLPG